MIFGNPLFTYPASQVGLVDLHAAVLKNDTDAIKKLISSGTDVNCKSNDGTTPLHLACFFGKVNSAELLINNGANLEAREDRGNTPLSLAAINGQVEIVKLLLSRGADVNARDKNGRTPLEIIMTYKENLPKPNFLTSTFVSNYQKNFDACIRLLREYEKQ